MNKLMVTKRNGELVDFDEERIKSAINKAVSASEKNLASDLLDQIINDIIVETQERFVDFFPNVENIQDIVEKHLVKNGLYEIAKTYILYRARRQKERDTEKQQNIQKSLLGKLTVKKRDGKLTLFDINKIKTTIRRASKDYEEDINIDLVAKEVIKNGYDGISTDEIGKALVLASISFIEKTPSYDKLSSRLFQQNLYKEVIGKSIRNDLLGISYREAFVNAIKKGVDAKVLDERMLDFDLEKLSYALKLDRDDLFMYMGIQTLYERYFMKIEEQRLELPQIFWMRVAMGLSLNEENKNEKAFEFYNLLSSMKYVSSTPTLFHSGTQCAQLSSCYLTTIMDDLNHIFKCNGDNANLSKWSGGLGNDWSNIRATGSWIKSTGVESQGVIPFLKIANDVTAAINRSGKRRGATCAYLETWHLEIEDFLDLRKNTGDERRRTHDMNTSNWIPDLFMKRVMNDENWTLFSPDETPELHHIYGNKFENKYLEYEDKARKGQLRQHKVISATKLWKKMLSRLFETGHPWITFKDPCNIRSPQDHCGVIHSSNLCTEITLNTSENETAVCNLGSINLSKHIINGVLDKEILAKTIKTAMRMLDNVIDLNYYPTKEAKHSNMLHRPVGLGIMGLQDAMFKLDINFDSVAAINFTDEVMELISYHAILSSSELAKERGTYQTYKGSKWDRNLFPIDTVKLLEEERGIRTGLNIEETLDWASVRAHVKEFGMRNSNCMAIAPTATIANISGCFPTIEPIYKNIYVKSNISGEFTVVNSFLVEDLKEIKLWNQDMLDQLKYYDGNISMIAGIPDRLKEKYKEAFQIDPLHCIKMTAVRSKWIDQSQSHNVFMKGVSGTKLNEIYIQAWKMGLKTTYYLRSLGASQIEKSTLDAQKFGYTQKREYHVEEKKTQQQVNLKNTEVEQQTIESHTSHTTPPRAIPVTQQTLNERGDGQIKLCRIEDPDCEACQ